MPVTTIRSLKPHKEDEFIKLLEHVYGIEPSWISVSYDDQGNAMADIDTAMDIDSRIAVHITDDGMIAEFSLFPAINKGKMLTNEEVENYLIKEKRLAQDLLIWANIKNSVQYFLGWYIVEKTLIAEGIPSEDGQDAWFALHFDQIDKHPKELEDGSVDFRDINHIVSVEENQLLISYHPETTGKEGLKVTGEKIIPPKGKKVFIHKGRGVYFDDERSGYAAQAAGHVTFENNRISVNPIYAVHGDVDFSVGNINFDGTVSISGDVLPGFEVRGKNIVVWGVVRDALLIAKEDITVKTGIKSTGKTKLQAGRDLFAGFSENAELRAGSSVTVRYYCFNSKVFSDGDVSVYTGDGIISGGEIHAFSSVRARRFGMEQGPSFKVFVGVKPTLQDRLDTEMGAKDRLEQVIKETDDKIRKMIKMNPDVKKDPKLKTILTSRNLLIKKFEAEDEKIEQMIKTSVHPMPFIRVDESLGDGVTLVFYSTERHFSEAEGAGKYIFNKSTGKIDRVKPDAPLENFEVTEVKLDE